MIVGRTSYLSVGHCSKPTFFLKRLHAPEKFSILFPSFLVFLFLLDFLGHLILFFGFVKLASSLSLPAIAGLVKKVQYVG
jgi:hypothetical protein